MTVEKTKFAQALEAKGIKPSVAADILGVSIQTITNWKAREVPFRKVKEVSEKLDIPPVELNDLYRLVGSRDAPSEDGWGNQKENTLLRIMETPPAEYEQPTSVQVPEIDIFASLGRGNVFSEADIKRNWQIEEALLFRDGIDPKDARLMMCQGDSMEPLIHDGDMVLLDMNLRGAEPGLYAFDSGHGLQIKRIVVNVLDGTVTVKSENPKYPPTTYTAEQAANEIKPFARVVRKYWGLLK